MDLVKKNNYMNYNRKRKVGNLITNKHLKSKRIIIKNNNKMGNINNNNNKNNNNNNKTVIVINKISKIREINNNLFIKILTRIVMIITFWKRQILILLIQQLILKKFSNK